MADLARDIVLRWKSEVKPAPKSKPASGGGSGSTEAAAHQKRSGAGTIPKVKPPTVPSAHSKPQGVVPPGGRSKEVDKVNWRCLGDNVRDNCVGMIYDGLCFESDAGELCNAEVHYTFRLVQMN